MKTGPTILGKGRKALRELHSFSALLFLLGISLVASHASAQGDTLHVLKISNQKDLQQYFAYTGQDRPLISGHRGGMTKGCPENSIETFENTLRHTPAFFEVDPRLTRDSVIVLLHDATLDRTTNGKGKLSDYTWEEVKKLRLKDKEGNLTSFRIPTLEEAIRWSKGKTVLNLDKKDVPLAITAQLLQSYHKEIPIMVTVHNAEQARFYYEQVPDIMFSAFVLTKEALFAYEKTGIPWSQVMAYIGPQNQPENKELIDLLHARGVMCMISAAPTYDKLTDTAERMQAYRDIISSGVNVIESDLPIDAAEAIRSQLPAKTKKAVFFTKTVRTDN
jgi:glycerophosphoryl diester phosphodiesterase